MSYASKDLEDLITPVPDDVLSFVNAEQTADLRSLKRSWRGFKRLKAQEEVLTQQLSGFAVKSRQGGRLSMKAKRRTPAVAVSTKKAIRVPKSLESFANRSSSTFPSRKPTPNTQSQPREREQTNKTPSVSSYASKSYAPSRATTAMGDRETQQASRQSGRHPGSRSRPPSARSRPTSAKSYHSVYSSAESVGPSTSNPTTHHHTREEQLWYEDEDVDEVSAIVDKLSLNTKGGNGGSPKSQKNDDQQQHHAPSPPQHSQRKRKVPVFTPIERIASLYSQTAWVRTPQREATLKGKSRREPNPPPPLEAPPTYQGVAGSDPLLSHFLNLEDFDAREIEEVDVEAMLIERGTEGVPALSQYRMLGAAEAVWEPCKIITFNAEDALYEIVWDRCGLRKWVSRLNICILEVEEVETVEKRVALAAGLRDIAERQIRQELVIDEVHDSVITPPDPIQTARILKKVDLSSRFTINFDIEAKNLTDLDIMYRHAVKTSVFNYKFLRAGERQETSTLSLPYRPPKPPPICLSELNGTEAVPEGNLEKFFQNRQHIADNLFSTHRVLYHTLQKLVDKWRSYHTKALFDCEHTELATPCLVGDFREHQLSYLQCVTDVLKRECTAATVSIIQNDLVGKISFYDDDITRFNGGRMKRFLRMVNMRLGQQLRSLVQEALSSYTAYLTQYKCNNEWEEISAEKSRKKKGGLRDKFRFGDGNGEDSTGPPPPSPTPPGSILFTQRFLELVGASSMDGVRTTAAPLLRKAHLPPPDPEIEALRKMQELRKSRASIGYSPDDESAPHPGTIEFIRARGRRSTQLSASGILDPPTEEEEKEEEEETSVPKLSISGVVSLFKIRLTTRGAGFLFEPSLEDIGNALHAVIGNFYSETDELVGVGEQLFPLLQLPPFRLNAYLKDNSENVAAVDAVTDVVQKNIRGPNKLKQLYEVFRYLLEIDADTFLASFFSAEPEPVLEDYRFVCSRLQNDTDAIATCTLNEVSFPLIKVECYEVKQHLCEKAKAIMNSLMGRLTDICTAQILSVDEQYKQIFSKIKVIPQTPEELIQLKQYSDSIPEVLCELNVEFEEIGKTVALLATFGHTPGSESFDTYWATYSRPKKIVDELQDSDFRYRENRNRFMQELRDRTERLTEDVHSTKKQVELLAYEDDDSHLEETSALVTNIRERLTEFTAIADQLNRHECIFNMQVTKHSCIREVSLSFEPYEKLWTIAYQFAEHYEKWTAGPLLALSADEVEARAAKWMKELNKLHRALANEAPHIIVRQLKDRLDIFRPHIPLVNALLERGVKARHWESFGKLIGREGKTKLVVNDDLTLNQLLELGMSDKLQEVQAISESAGKERKLEDQLERMKVEWKGRQFTLKPYEGTLLLTEIDAIQQLLDDHIVKTQTLLGSVDVQYIESVVRNWEHTLLRMQGIVDEWLRCQTMWSYLSPIFSSPDLAKSLPGEATQFEKVDMMWKSVMQICATDPRVEIRCSEDRLLQAFEDANRSLENVLKHLHRFLETKRVAFPRFYYLPNDDLLEIMSDMTCPEKLQPHLKKCFEGISSLTFSAGNAEVTGMVSVEDEKVALVSTVNPSESEYLAEVWLKKVEKEMYNTIAHVTGQCIADYVQREASFSPQKRVEWMCQFPGQVVISCSQVHWANEVEDAMLAGLEGMTAYAKKLKLQLNCLVDAVRNPGLTAVQQCTLQAMIVIDVHSNDTVAELHRQSTFDPNEFAYLVQLRYYYQDLPSSGRRKTQGIVIKQSNAIIEYGNEYLGNSSRLVITPLTDRCYRTLIGAMHLSYGGAPEGPAGTGKTETTKDLAKCLAKFCLVTNCSDQMSPVEMAKTFRGLTAAGAWGCFDEFNRIEIQVLSVVAQQISCIQRAISEDRCEFDFEGTFNAMEKGCAIFITMNPGYAGRAELPDNLKTLFRPVAMMVPDYAMIGEILLFSCGFQEGRDLARKIVACFKLCSEQLSTQQHYDYGMRAVKTVLSASGILLREQDLLLERNPEAETLSERQIVLKALYNVNYPKFLSEDLLLFELITQDVFPDVAVPAATNQRLEDGLHDAGNDLKLDITERFKKKAFELQETSTTRHGVMLIGESYGGKSSSLNSLARAQQRLGFSVKTAVINPKSVTIAQLYGTNDAAGEWVDGVLSKIFKSASRCTLESQKHWIVLDGPVDALWIESMNTTLDDNKKLSLLNGDNIKMTSRMNLFFETDNLLAASPATVSRCGMVYYTLQTAECITSIRKTWVNALPIEVIISKNQINALLDVFLMSTVIFLKRHTETKGDFCLPNVTISLVNCAVSFFALFKGFLFTVFGLNYVGERVKTNTIDALTDCEVNAYVEGFFLLSLAWGFGGGLSTHGRNEFSGHLVRKIKSLKMSSKEREKEKEKEASEEANTPHVELNVQPPSFDANPEFFSLFDYCFVADIETSGYQWIPWLALNASTQDTATQFHEVIVHTADTSRLAFFLSRLVDAEVPALITGCTGTGKSLIVKNVIKEKMASSPESENNLFLSHYIQLSGRTTASQIRHSLEARLESRSKTVMRPPHGKKCIVFIDDLSMPTAEMNGAQPPLELLRQWQDRGGWYTFKAASTAGVRSVEGLSLVSCRSQDKNAVSARILRHFAQFSVQEFDEETLFSVFSSLLEWIATSNSYPAGVDLKAQHSIIHASIALYQKVKTTFSATPDTPHYAFNVRDLFKVFQGMNLCAGVTINGFENVCKLWVHECTRVFSDRLIVDMDENRFREALNSVMHTYLKRPLISCLNEDPNSPIIFDAITFAAEEEPMYRDMADFGALRSRVEVLQREHDGRAALQSQQGGTSQGLNLVIFDYVVQHVSRVARILKLQGGHALLIGLGGRGRQSCAKLATALCEYELFRTKCIKSYGRENWRDDLRAVIKAAAGPTNAAPTTFLLTDECIKDESFLEDVSCLLNTGEIPELFEEEECASLLEGIARLAKEQGIRNLHTREQLWDFFVVRTQAELHVVMCFSPVGDVLRTRLRVFPALANCCSIDHFGSWPAEGLVSLGKHFLEQVPDIPPNIREKVVNSMVQIHTTTREAATAYQVSTGHALHVTPTAFLEILASFKSLFEIKTAQAANLQRRYTVGIEQLKTTEQSVGAMQSLLEVQQPNLVRMKEETTALIAHIEEDEEEADITRQSVAIEERAANEKAEEARKIKEACQSVLSRAMPALDAAMAQLQEIDKRQIVEIRTMTNPSEKVKQVMASVCVCLGIKPIMESDPTNPLSKKKRPEYWGPAKKLMSDTNEFLTLLLTYKDRDEGLDPIIFESGTGLIQPFIHDKNFLPDKVRSLSKALAPVCAWVLAMEKYYQVEKRVRPKKAELGVAQEEYDRAMEILMLKKEELATIDHRLERMRGELATRQRERKSLEDEYGVTVKKLDRAEKIIVGLAGEKVRYVQQLEVQKSAAQHVIGDCVLSASHFAYLAAFPQVYREKMLSRWRIHVSQQVPVSPSYSLRMMLGDDVVVEEWAMQGLPHDSFSVDNALIMEHSRRSALLLDPEQQACVWLKERYSRANLQVLTSHQEGYIKSIAVAVRTGCPVLVELSSTYIDPALNPLLLKQFSKDMNGNYRVTIGDQDVEVHKNWLCTGSDGDGKRASLFLAIKEANPGFTPETAAKVTMVTFGITTEGLQSQVLGRVVQFEEREQYDKKTMNVKQSTINKLELKRKEDEILGLLSEEGSILDNETAITALNEAKRVAEETQVAQNEVERILAQFDRTKKRFTDVAVKVSALFFCISEFREVSCMYIFSLQWFLAVFGRALEASKQQDADLVNEDRNASIVHTFVESIFKNVSRSLMAEHCLLLSFLMSCALAVDIPPEYITFICTLGMDQPIPRNPICPQWCPESAWKSVIKLSRHLPEHFGNLDMIIANEKEREFREWYSLEKPFAFPGENEDVITTTSTGVGFLPDVGLHRASDGRGDSVKINFLKLLLLRALRPDCFVLGVKQFIATHPLLGEKYTVSPVTSIAQIYREASSGPTTPIVFVLTPGVDPMTEVRDLASSEQMALRMHTVSLGQGVRERVEKLLSEGRASGWWVVLQNCHLYQDWMPSLERIISECARPTKASSVHPDFRLWLTSLPCSYFPQTALTSGLKIMLEPPKGLKANMQTSFSGMLLSDPDFYGGDVVWKRLCFALTFFHGVVQERRSYGALGWNIPYGFNGTDLSISLKLLKELLEAYDAVPWDALLYLTGECNYGGRVTDERDRRLLSVLLQRFYNEKVLDADHCFDDTDLTNKNDPFQEEPPHLFYKQIDPKVQEPLTHIQKFPEETPASIQGFHSNADIVKSQREGASLMADIIAASPKLLNGVDEGDEEGSDLFALNPDQVDSEKALSADIARTLLDTFPKNFAVDTVRAKYPVSFEASLHTVLLTEVMRYNTLLDVVRLSLKQLCEAFRGDTILTEVLEEMGSELFHGKIPSLWLKASYPSVKSLQAYVLDLKKRVAFLGDWIEIGAPKVFWLPGFYFTQVFLTAVQQQHSRKHNMEIDSLTWNFDILKPDSPELAKEVDGCLVNGLHLEGAAWNARQGVLVEAEHRVLYESFPTVWLTNKERKHTISKLASHEFDNECGKASGDIVHLKVPLYRTTERKGVLRYGFEFGFPKGYRRDFIL